MLNPQDKKALADKFAELALNIQAFFDSQQLTQGAAEGEEGQELMNIQSDLCEAYHDLTGKDVFRH